MIPLCTNGVQWVTAIKTSLWQAWTQQLSLVTICLSSTWQFCRARLPKEVTLLLLLWFCTALCEGLCVFIDLLGPDAFLGCRSKHSPVYLVYLMLSRKELGSFEQKLGYWTTLWKLHFVCAWFQFFELRRGWSPRLVVFNISYEKKKFTLPIFEVLKRIWGLS